MVEINFAYCHYYYNILFTVLFTGIIAYIANTTLAQRESFLFT